MPRPLRLVLLADTHRRHDLEVPDGDVLVHAGDGCSFGSLAEARLWGAFLASLPHPHKVVIAGNHDRCFEDTPAAARRELGEVTYLEDSGVEIEGVAFWGSPWQPWFGSWAFNLQRGPELAEKWARIPTGTDVLITHGPPRSILDRTVSGREVGCDDLRDAVERLRPRLHVFGHIHEARGQTRRAGTLFVNASICDVRYQPTGRPVVVDLPPDRSEPAALVSA